MTALTPQASTRTLLALAAILAVGACTGGRSSGPPDAPVVVTFEVVDERFKALLTEP
jgi:hypothetical protein